MRSAKAPVALSACLALAVLSACRQEAPVVGPKVTPVVTAPAGPQIEKIAGASVDATNHVVVFLRIVMDGAAATLDEALAAEPSWTLAALSTDPLSGLPAWRSHLLTGAQTLGGPGTPPGYVVAGTKQPGAETSGALEALGGGDFKYTYANALPASYVPAETLRVGVFLGGVSRATPQTVATFDFAPSGGPVAGRDTVLDANCNGCHGTLRAHGGTRTTVRLCLTCHTWQNADADTVDPAATAGATPATDPNPLDLGRLVHRIHRGKNLPTLYKASSTAAAAPLVPPSATPLPLPFHPSRTTGAALKNAPVPGARFAIVGALSRERVYGKIETRADNDQPARTQAAGVVFPRDLRDCDACHGGAPQRSVVEGELFRRTCAGCHPDVWFGDGTTVPRDSPDAVHMPHPGGPQVDDSKCVECHAPAPVGVTPYAPVGALHVPPVKSPWYNEPSAKILEVTGLAAGQRPRVVLKVTDEDGVVTPLNTPTPNANGTPVTPSPVPRGLRLSVTYAGPTEPDYVTSFNLAVTTNPNTEALPANARAVPRECTPGAADPSCVCTPVAPATTCVTTSSLRTCTPGADDLACTCTAAPGKTCTVPVDDPALPGPCTLLSPCYSFIFMNRVSADAAGTWAVAAEGRRSSVTNHYVVTPLLTPPVPPESQFPWPYTGESISENMENPVVYVDTAVGTLGTPGAPLGNPVPRREVVDRRQCDTCHMRLGAHGELRHAIEYCVMCHTPNRTDWARRPKDPAGSVALSTPRVCTPGTADPNCLCTPVPFATTCVQPAVYDGLEESSIHFKVLLHRLHTGEHEGPASLGLLEPYVVYGYGQTPWFFGESEFPGDLANCTLCHVGDSYTLTGMPDGLAPTVANETPTIRHGAGAAHAEDEKRTPPITAACMGCHATAYSLSHTTQRTTAAGVEQCAQCHEKGQYAVKKVHGIPETTTP